ncbi:MAG: ABC transporter ATP-binding protein [Bdellovibrionota bacterium]
MFDQLKIYKAFLGPKVLSYLGASTVIGMLWFLADFSFVFVLQFFLVSIGLVKADLTFLPFHVSPSVLNASIILLSFGLIRSGMLFLKTFLGMVAQNTFSCEQRARIFSLGIREGQNINSKEVVSLFSEAITQSSIFIQLLINMIVTSFSGTLFFLLGMYLAPIEMILGVFILFVLLYPFLRLVRLSEKYGIAVTQEFEFLNSEIINSLKNNLLLKIYNKIDERIREANKSLENYRVHSNSYFKTDALLGAAPVFLGLLTLSSISYFSTGVLKTEPMKLLSFFYIFIRFTQCSSELHTAYSSFKYRTPYIVSIFNFYLKDIRTKNNLLEKTEAPATINNIDIQKVSFGYRKGEYLFKNISINLTKGKCCVIVGESGVGKSTLLSILLGIIRPQEGLIKYNDEDIFESYTLFSKKIGYVGPEPFLVPGTVRENLSYGYDGKLTDTEMFSILEKVGVGKIFNSENDGLNQFLNEHAPLSAGQKQRLAICRAILRRPDVFILDEATSNLDKDTEKEIINLFRELKKTSILCIVTHRDSFHELADQVVHMK